MKWSSVNNIKATCCGLFGGKPTPWKVQIMREVPGTDHFVHAVKVKGKSKKKSDKKLH